MALAASAGVIWLSLVLAGSFWMLRYGSEPGPATEAPAHWPAGARAERKSGESTLVMFVHPKCPCTRATLGELAILMAHCSERISAHVLFLRPAGTSAEWTQTPLWQQANSIPGVTALVDDDGLEAKRFHMQTSGDTLLYNANGELIFHGGITAARGHSGDNAGRSALQTLILNTNMSSPALARTPVFGCSLNNPSQECCTQPNPKNSHHD